jgi:hypothetical protein
VNLLCNPSKIKALQQEHEKMSALYFCTRKTLVKRANACHILTSLEIHAKDDSFVTKKALAYSAPFQRALTSVEGFDHGAVAVMPEMPDAEMLRYTAQVTGLDQDLLRRLYQIFVNTSRLDKFSTSTLPPSAGFAEE